MNTTPVQLKFGHRYTYVTGGTSAPLVKAAHAGGFWDPSQNQLVEVRHFASELALPPLRLEVGKRYVRRDGRITRPLEPTEPTHPHHDTHPFRAPDFLPRPGYPPRGTTHTPEGRWSVKSSISDADLVAEYVEHAEPAKPPLRLEVGKFYKTANGTVCGPIKRRTPGGDRSHYSVEEFPFACPTPYHAHEDFREDGTWSLNPADRSVQFDLVAECPAPASFKPAPLRLEVGKYYVNREGVVCGPVLVSVLGVHCDNLTTIREFPYVARHPQHDSLELFRGDGSWGLPEGYPQSYDLVAECPTPTTPTIPNPTTDPGQQLVAAIVSESEKDLRSEIHQLAINLCNGVCRIDPGALRTADWSRLAGVPSGTDFATELTEVLVIACRQQHTRQAFERAARLLQIPLASARLPSKVGPVL